MIKGQLMSGIKLKINSRYAWVGSPFTTLLVPVLLDLSCKGLGPEALRSRVQRDPGFPKIRKPSRC